MFPNSDHPNAALIAYGSFGSPFLTSDYMNASDAFASISIVISIMYLNTKQTNIM